MSALQSGALNITVLATVLLLLFCVYVMDIEKERLWTETVIVTADTYHNSHESMYQLAIAPPCNSSTSISNYLPQHAFNCSAVIEGDIFEIRRAERYLGLVKYNRATDPQLNSSSHEPALHSKKCRSLSAEMNRYPPTTSDSSYPLAFTVLAYQNPSQLHRLLRAIYRSWNYYCIHIDKTSSVELVSYAETLALCVPNIMLATKRFNVKWGALTVLSAAMQCFDDIRHRTNQWNYLVNIAATDFPLMTNLQLVDYLRNRHGASDVESMVRKDAWRYTYAFTGGAKALNQFISCQKRKNKLKKSSSPKYKTLNCGTFTKKPAPPFGMTMHKGSFSAMLERNFVDFLFDSEEAEALLAWLGDTFIPDEYLWPTLYHSVYKQRHNLTVYDQFATRYTHWATMKPSCGGYYEHGLCVFGVSDLRWIAGKDAVYAHKFDSKMQPMALLCLEQRNVELVAKEYGQA